jgi:hypothetical protein
MTKKELAILGAILLVSASALYLIAAFTDTPNKCVSEVQVIENTVHVKTEKIQVTYYKDGEIVDVKTTQIGGKDVVYLQEGFTYIVEAI